jgi:hypothetical protein
VATATFQKCSSFGKLDSCGKFSAVSVNVPLQFFALNNFNALFEDFCGVFHYLATVIEAMVPSGVEEGWKNSLILQTNAAHLAKMKHWSRFNKDAPVAWYSYTYKFFALTTQLYCSGQEKPDLEVVVVRRKINLGTGNLEWGGNGEGLRKGRSVYG